MSLNDTALAVINGVSLELDAAAREAAQEVLAAIHTPEQREAVRQNLLAIRENFVNTTYIDDLLVALDAPR